jgi:hypothetical protein
VTQFLSISQPAQPAFLFAAYGPLAAVSASSTAAGYDAVDLLQADECNGWRPATTALSSVIIDLGAAESCEFCALAGADLHGVSLAVQGSNDGSTFTSLATQVAPRDGAVWIQLAQATYRYFRLSISGHSTKFLLKHIAVGGLSLLPFFEDGYCSAPLQADGTHLISTAGLFLGSVTTKVTRPFSLSFGQITPVEEALFSIWAAACIQTARGFFLVPDTSQDEVHFGYTEKGYKYEPVMKTGLYTIPRIPFISRVVA